MEGSSHCRVPCCLPREGVGLVGLNGTSSHPLVINTIRLLGCVPFSWKELVEFYNKIFSKHTTVQVYHFWNKKNRRLKVLSTHLNDSINVTYPSSLPLPMIRVSYKSTVLLSTELLTLYIPISDLTQRILTFFPKISFLSLLRLLLY